MRKSWFFEFSVHDKDWGEIKILRILPNDDDPWGDLAPLRETIWAQGVQTVSGESLSHALHGWAIPLLDELGDRSHQRIRRMPKMWCELYTNKRCLIRASYCYPNKKVPECYTVVPEFQGLQSAVYKIVMAWKENRYVVVVEGEEFSL